VALCLSVSRSLHLIDLRGLPFAMRGLLDALELDNAALLQQAYGTFAMVCAGHMPNLLVEPALERCGLLTTQLNQPRAHAHFQLALAEVEHFRGDFAAAERACEHAERTLLSACTSITRELGQVRLLALAMLHNDKGDFRTHASRALDWLADADRRGDVFYGNWLRAVYGLAWVAQDEPERARAEIARAEESWPAARGGMFETVCTLYLDVCDRYEDRPDVQDRPAQGRPSVLESPVANAQLLQGYLHLQQAWGCLRELGVRAESRSDEGRSQLRARAGQALAACARRRRGELNPGELGERWIAEADSELERLGVRVPERFARAYFSIFPV
jgi:hypothetical protein